MNPIQCFLIEPTETTQRYLRRFKFSSGDGHTHDAMAPLDVVAIRWKVTVGGNRYCCSESKDLPAKEDPRWPAACACGYVFEPGDEYQIFTDRIFQCGTEAKPSRDWGAGAMFYADWLQDVYQGPDGKCLIVRIPMTGGTHDWNVDGRCSNCGRPEDRVHKCWVRHGEPPNITVDKNGDTCAAGAGSIIVDGWHGFLRNGYLVSC